MTAAEIPAKYDLIASKTAAMLTIQQEYFAGRKRGYNEPHKLDACKRIEAEVKDLVAKMEADSLNPELFVGDENKAIYKEYTHFFGRVKYLQATQQRYFKEKGTALMYKCKALEHEVAKLIKDKYIKAKSQQQPSLF